MADTLYISSFTKIYGNGPYNPISNAQNDNLDYFYMTGEWVAGAEQWLIDTGYMTFTTSQPNGRDFWLSFHITQNVGSCLIRINDTTFRSGLNLDQDNQWKAGVNTVRFYSYSGTSQNNMRVYYYKMVEEPPPGPSGIAKINNIPIADIAKIDDIILSDIAKINNIA